MHGLVGESRAADIVHLALKTVFKNIMMEKLFTHEQDEQTVRWTENQTNSWAQMVLISDVKYSWRPLTNEQHDQHLFNELVNGSSVISEFGDNTKLRSS